ncbi:hypothetical protein HDE_05982 [Halotydeus destructor]|nr:hypothetical protein HDE_05982 [Halotydeus destructor]
MTSVIAIDDIEATLGDCPTTDSYHCDFDQADEENIDCSWLLPYSTTKNYQWWASWPGERKLAIADADHSTKSKYGGYLTAYDNGKAADDEQVGLRLPEWTQHSSYCFSFWFYYAENVHIQLLESTQGPRELRDVLGVNKFCDRKWCQKQYQINGVYGKRAWLSLIMSRTAVTTGVAAFDSLSLVPGECRKAASCDFFSDFCGYQVTGPWVLGTGRLTNPTRVAYDFVRPTNVSRYVYRTSPYLNCAKIK